MVVALVDDDWGTLELASYFLKKSGYTMFTFSDSQECWEWISKSSNTCPDILISDLMMPFFDGAELITKVRTETHCSHIPVILISSIEKVENRENLWDIFLPKAFKRQQLLEAIDKAVERRKSQNERH